MFYENKKHERNQKPKRPLNFFSVTTSREVSWRMEGGSCNNMRKGRSNRTSMRNNFKIWKIKKKDPHLNMLNLTTTTTRHHHLKTFRFFFLFFSHQILLVYFNDARTKKQKQNKKNNNDDDTKPRREKESLILWFIFQLFFFVLAEYLFIYWVLFLLRFFRFFFSILPEN